MASQVRLVDALEGWAYSLPAWRTKIEMLKLIRELMEKLLVDTVAKVAKPGFKKSGDVSIWFACSDSAMRRPLDCVRDCHDIVFSTTYRLTPFDHTTCPIRSRRISRPYWRR